MSLFFKEGSQVSDYENTAFFQNGDASKASIFDNPPQSETQLAYELFNIDSINPRDTKERSIISKLDLLERDTEEFMQTPLHDELKPISKRDPLIDSQESKDSRMTFGGGKFQNKLRESKAQLPKNYENPPKMIEEKKEKKESSKQRFSLGNRQTPNEPTSNFTHFRQAHPVREPESMPVKFDEIKSIAIPKPTFNCPSNSSSSFSIDFQEIRQRNQMEPKPIAKQITSLRINNEKDIKDVRSESGSSERLSDKCSSDARLQTKDPQKEKKFGFNLRRSKVSDENKDNKLQSSFLLKNNPTTSNVFNVSLANPANLTPTHQNKAQNPKNEEKPTSDQPMVTPFKLKTKDIAKDQPTEKVLLITSNVKKVDGERTTILHKNPPQPKLNIQREQSSKKQLFDRETRKTIEIRPKHSDDASNVRQTSPLFDSNEPQSKEKRQSIGLKEQLKKLTSRPTEKVQLKSIAFNKGFKFKPRPTEEKLQAKSEEANLTKQSESSFIIQKTAQVDQKTNNKSFMAFKEEKSDFATPKQSKSTDFTKYMLTLMELQQECEALKGRTARSRNSYRELAILNDDINRRIDEIFKDNTKR